jgi:hypothetical protein
MTIGERLERGFKALLEEPDEGPQSIGGVDLSMSEPSPSDVKAQRHYRHRVRAVSARRQAVERMAAKQQLWLFLEDAGIGPALRKMRDIRDEARKLSKRTVYFADLHPAWLRRVVLRPIHVAAKVSKLNSRYPAKVWLPSVFTEFYRATNLLVLRQDKLLMELAKLSGAIDYYTADPEEAAEWVVTMYRSGRLMFEGEGVGTVIVEGIRKTRKVRWELGRLIPIAGSRGEP